MPIYNGEKKIAIALDSLLNQTFKNFILIISDNNSTDNTENICRSYQKKDSRIKYYRNKQNIGATNNFQKTLNMAKTPYFMWAAHDDVWEPNFISELISILENDKNFILSFCNFDLISDDEKDNRYKNDNSSYFLFSKIRDTYTRLKYSIHQNLAMYIYGIYRTSILKKIGGFSTRSKGGYGDDNLLLMRLIYHGKFYMHPKLLFHKRDRSYVEPNSKITKMIAAFSTAKDYFVKQTRFQSFSRKIIKEGNISIAKKILLIYNTFICQIFIYLIILINNFLLNQSISQRKLSKYLQKIFLRDRFNRLK
ncbi:MAG: glycosyltransferase [Candidatus Lokiarchaeota archaeon]|nr:glycosyltransferase [Candidatus Lokiarchaeota archaeon]